ncbi:MAG TPA: hypothetical protein VD913_04430 [bacterium]|nr:hypothetical protein [bacterium]
MKLRAPWLLGFAGAVLLSSGLCASAAEDIPAVSVKAELDKAFITIGDPVQYTVTITRSPSVQVLSSIPIPPEDIFKIKKIDEFRREEKGMIIEGRKMNLTTYRLGEFILDPVKIDYRVGDGQPASIETDRIFLTVQSVAEGEQKVDIRGVKSVISIPQRYLKPILFTAATLFFAILAVFLFYIFRKKNLLQLVPEKPLTPEEEALLNLNRLFESDLLRKGKVKEYYLRLSEILRIYFEIRYDILAVESTTFEIMKLLSQKDMDAKLFEKIEEVLLAADLAKFAKWTPEPKEILEINRKAKSVVEESVPKEVRNGV